MNIVVQWGEYNISYSVSSAVQHKLKHSMPKPRHSRYCRIAINAAFFVIVFGFFNGSEITLPEQGEATVLSIGFIKGGNVQTLTAIDRRNVARFGITVTGSASKCELLELFLISTV